LETIWRWTSSSQLFGGGGGVRGGRKGEIEGGGNGMEKYVEGAGCGRGGWDTHRG
jgi:hypothetical protein